MKKFLYWLPRVLAVLITTFLSLFILEGFAPGFSLADAFVHFILAALMVLATVLAWKKPQIGGFFFLLFGIRFSSDFLRGQWLNGLVFGGIPILTGTLFLVEGFSKKKS